MVEDGRAFRSQLGKLLPQDFNLTLEPTDLPPYAESVCHDTALRSTVSATGRV